LIKKISNFQISERGRDLIFFTPNKKIKKISNSIKKRQKNQKPYTLLYNDDDDTEDEEEFENMVLFR
jgi:hypothetical protein